MAMTADQYLQQLQALLPSGAAWPRDPDAALTKTLGALAVEFARVDLRAEDLINEADPRTTVELLADWERVAALPDMVYSAGQSLDERQAALHAKITTVGGQSRAFFIALALRIGYVITITEYRPFTVNTACDQGIRDEEWRFVWQVNSAATTVREATCESQCIDPLRSWGNALLETVINKYKPAHTEALFTYGG